MVTLDGMFEQFPYALIVLDERYQVVSSNPEARAAFGSLAEIGARFPQRFRGGQHRLPSPEAQSSGWVVDVRELRDPSGHWLYVFRDDPQVAWVSEDTERLAFEDPLTGLPNFNILSQFIEHSCSQSQRYARSSALLRVDLDHLGQINSELGRSSGDEVLVQAAQRLQQNIRSSDIVGRIEGDQFLVLLSELTNERGGGGHLHVRGRAAVVAQRLNQAFRQPFAVADAKVNCSVSIGVSVCPEDARLTSEWLEAAQFALNQSKDNGGDGYELYAEALRQRHEEKQDTYRQLENSLREDELEFGWLPVHNADGQSSDLEHYWWRWPARQMEGAQVRDWIESAALHGLWGRWQKTHLESCAQQGGRIAPLPSAWLNPGADNAFMLADQWLWEADEASLQHRYRVQNLLHLQERGLRWILGATSRGLQNLALLGKLRPELLKLPLPSRVTPDQQRLLIASAEAARSLDIQLLVTVPAGAELGNLVERLAPRWVVSLPAAT